MNILLINHYAGSPKLGMEYRPYYMAKHWCRMGHKVTIIAASQSHVRSTQPIISNRFEEEELEGIKYIWLKTPSYNGNGIGRIFNMLIFIYKLFMYSKKIINKAKPDVVIASSTYPLDILPAYRISVKSKSKLIFEVHDLWPLSPIEIGGFSKWNPFIVIMQCAENFAYKHSSQVVSMLPMTLKHMVDHGLIPEKFNYVPNGIEIDEWKENELLPIDHKNLIIALKKENHKLVSYTGSFGLANALDFLIDAAKILEKENISFLIVGKGPEREKLFKKIKTLDLKNVFILDSVRKEVIPALLSEMDILYIGLRKQPLFRFGISPNKLIDYMMAARPIIQAIDAGNDIVTESNCGITIEPENQQDIAEAIRKIINLSEFERKEMGENGKKFVIENHNYKFLANKFIEILQK
ncbi:MAG: glycosyltransferase family 4 protein [Bacteroidales bacterium]